MILDRKKLRLPADIPAVFAYSTNRKLRKLYSGQYFRYSDGENELDYPNNTPVDGNKIVRIYDQKAHADHSAYDAIQEDPELQPTVHIENGVPVAKFNNKEFLSVSEFNHSTTNCSIIVKGEGLHPRPSPAVGGWGGINLTVEPGVQCSKCWLGYKYILLNSNNKITQVFVGDDIYQQGRALKGKAIDADGAIVVPSGTWTFRILVSVDQKLSIHRYI